jgi:VCBS repeat-containing protein
MSAPTRRPTPWATPTSAARSARGQLHRRPGHGRDRDLSSATAAIAGVNDPHTGGASITGTATEDQVLTAVSTLADADGLGTLHYQWQHNVGSGFVNIVGAADQATYTLGDGDVGGVVRVVISYTDGQGFAESATSASTPSIANVNDAPTGGVSITGATTENQVLTANTSALADIDGLGTLHYQWQRNVGSGFVNVGSDQATYTLGDADVGGTVRVVVSYVDAQGTAEAVTSSASAAIAGVNDPHTGGASITGTATENQVLTAVSTLADVDGLGTLHYQWQHNVGSGFVNIVGAADQATYTLGDGDVGGVVRVVISYTDGQGFAESATSASTPSIANVNDPHTGGVAVTGATNENQVLTADTSTLADADGLGTLHYQWQRDSGSGFVNVGADQPTYALAAADVGAVIRVVTSYVDAQGTAEAATSAATATILPANGPHTGGVSVAGTVTEDQVLTADTSSLADPGGLGAFHYQWQRSTSRRAYVNVGTDQATYTLGDADVGAQIRVVVSYTDGQGVFESETSGPTAAVANVNDAPTGGVTITGTVTEDQVLTADAATLADADGLGPLHYQWQRDSGGGYVNVGTDQATYALGDADVGATIRVVTTYTDQQGAPESRTSAATAAVANVNDAPTAANDADAVAQRLTVTGSVRANDGDIDNALAALTVTNVAYNATHVDQAVVSGGTVVNGANGKLTINPDGTYSYAADHEGLVVGQVVTDTFDYTIKDPSGASATAQLTVTVTGSATGDANANILISDGSAHTLTGRGGADTLTGGGGADVFAYEAIGDSTVAAFDTITDFTHGADTLQLTPLITGATKLTLATDGTDKILSIDLDGDGTAEGQIKALGQGLEVTDIVTGVANFGFTINGSAGGETLTGGSGADTINGAGGADLIRGGAGGRHAYRRGGDRHLPLGAGDSTILHWDTITDFATGEGQAGHLGRRRRDRGDRPLRVQHLRLFRLGRERGRRADQRRHQDVRPDRQRRGPWLHVLRRRRGRDPDRHRGRRRPGRRFGDHHPERRRRGRHPLWRVRQRHLPVHGDLAVQLRRLRRDLRVRLRPRQDRHLGDRRRQDHHRALRRNDLRLFGAGRRRRQPGRGRGVGNIVEGHRPGHQRRSDPGLRPGGRRRQPQCRRHPGRRRRQRHPLRPGRQRHPDRGRRGGLHARRGRGGHLRLHLGRRKLALRHGPDLRLQLSPGRQAGPERHRRQFRHGRQRRLLGGDQLLRRGRAR